MKIPVKSQYFHAKTVLLSGAKRSEKDCVLPRRNSGRRGRVLPRRNSGEAQFGRDAIREAKLCWLNPVFRKLISIAAFLQLILHRLKDYL
jgi:hypothetical protein